MKGGGVTRPNTRWSGRVQQRLGGPAGAALAAAMLVSLALYAPVVVRGAPLADDFHTCMRPITDGSFAPFLEASWSEMGAVRPARFLEIAVIGGLCRSVPFGLIIAIPLALKLLTAVMLRGLLRELRLRAPWPEIGAVVWLLEPLGAEAALWPSALHVPLALALALGALRLYRRGRLGWAALLTLAASLSAEQVIFAFPLAVWLVAGPHRRRATATAAVAVGAVLVAYATWSGNDFRTDVSLIGRLAALVQDPEWYVFFPAVGLGAHSAALAMVWAFPVSVLLVAATTAAAAWSSTRFPPTGPRRRLWEGMHPRLLVSVVLLAALINLPLAVTVPRGYSPRTFTPTWLLLSAVVALAAGAVAWRPGRLQAAIAGALAGVAVLSMALSVSVRVRTADFTEASSRWLAANVPEGGSVQVCDVPRTAVEPAPLGAFALHELHWEWAAQDAVAYYTGRELTVRREGRYWPGSCPSSPAADVTLTFAELRSAAAGG